MSSEENFTHLDPEGNPQMVDVGHKAITERLATARSLVVLPPEVLKHFSGQDIHTKKGPVFHTARLAGTMAAKKTWDLIPLCHPLLLSSVKFQIGMMEGRENTVEILCTVKVSGKTGVEMEALTGASVAALTIYDMCKAFTHDIEIQETKLIAKSGGKRDFQR
ncbi:MAG: cyclic pyranopterin monophosphate synthase MoaC [Bacteroidota bacterium]